MSIRRNSALNVAGALVPLATSLATLPLYLGLIGEARYGILAIAWLLLGYFGLFDFGLGRATAQRIAALRDGRAEERAEAFWTAVAMNLGLGCLGGVLLWPVAVYVLGSVVKADPALESEIRGAIPWLILALPMGTIISVLSGALQGKERFVETNAISVVGTTIFQLAPLSAALSWGADLRILLPAALAARLLTALLLFWRCLRHVGRSRAFVFSRVEARRLLRFGGWITISWVVGPLMTALDRFVIGALSGAATVAHYTVPFQLARSTAILPSALSSALFPRFSHGSAAERGRLSLDAMRALTAVMSPLVAGAVLLIGPFLSWWISPPFAEQSAVLGQILLIGFWLNGLAAIPHGLLQAQGRPDLVAKCHLAELLPYLMLLFSGLVLLGAPGAALAFSLRAAADFVLLASFAGMLGPALRLMAAPAAGLFLAVSIAIGLAMGGLHWWLATTALAASFIFIGTIIAPPSVTAALRRPLRRFRAAHTSRTET